MTSVGNAPRRRRSTHREPSHIVAFRSGAEIESQEALGRELSIARSANVFGVEDFDDQYWPLRSRARASDAGAGGLNFTIEPARKGTRLPPFPEPFMAFVKVMVCAFERRSDSGFSASNLQTVVSACRWLFGQFGTRKPFPHLLTHGDFAAAAQAAKAQMGEGAANIGSKLAFISRQMDVLGLAPTQVGWRNSIRREAKHTDIGPVAERRRAELMPDPSIIDALADISACSDLDDRDLIIQRALEVTVGVGFRVNELLTLPRDCLVSEPDLDDLGNQLLDNLGKPIVRVGLRYWPEKGARETRIKWVPTVMSEVVVRAIEDIQRITYPTWRAATYQSEFPNGTLLGDPWDALADSDAISLPELREALGVSDPHQYLSDHDIPFVTDWSSVGKRTRFSTATRVKMGDLRQHLFERSERGNVLRRREGRQEVSDSLFLVPMFFVKRSMRGGLRGTVTLVKDANVYLYLVGLKDSPSIFERLSILDANGEPLRCPSHKLRHWLNTLALEGGLSDVDLARWMGRRNIAQNRAYDHRTPVQRARSAEARMHAGQTIGPAADAYKNMKDPVRRDEFAKSMHRTAHVTDLGTCVHDWDALPCQRHGSCSDCFELRIEKGNQQQRERAAIMLEETDAELAQAQAEATDATIGADRWVEAHQRTAKSLRKIIAVHDDPNIPNGYIVQLSGL